MISETVGLIKEIVKNVLVMILLGWIVFGLVIPNIRFGLWGLSPEHIKIVITIGFVWAILLKLSKIKIKKEQDGKKLSENLDKNCLKNCQEVDNFIEVE